MALIYKHESQSIFDLLLVEAGGISCLFDFLDKNGLTDLDIPTGDYIKPSVINQSVADYFSKSNVSVSTSALGGIAYGAPTVLKLNGEPFLSVAGGASEDIELVDQNDDPIIPISVVGKRIKVDVPECGSITVGAKPLKTGISTSKGREVDYLTINYTNPYGNTNRWTDVFGGQTFANNIVLDWSTYDGFEVIGYYRVLPSGMSYDDSQAWALALVVDGFSVWHVVDTNEYLNTTKLNGTTAIFDNKIHPLNLPAAQIWTSSPTGATTAWAAYNYVAALFENNTKAQLFRPLACRYFTVTGTTLT